MKILLVDDNYDTRTIFRLYFQMAGHYCHTASNGYEAVQAAQEEVFDIIVMDIEIPGVSGWEAVRQIRALPLCSDIPILMFTAYNHDEAKALEAGANGFLRKPIAPQALLAYLQQWS
jgi:CheY-like chemotaxis protein